MALSARRHLAEAGASDLCPQVAAYRSGYLPEERRALEEGLRNGALSALAATTALELGVNVTGLDAVLMAGWPGTRAALWQQAGRAGRDGREAVAVLIARDDPLDTYLVHHPQALLGAPVEATVLDPDNSYVLTPHLCAAAAELPLSEPDLASFTETAGPLAARMAADGLLRSRGGRWYCTRRGSAVRTGLRGTGGPAGADHRGIHRAARRHDGRAIGALPRARGRGVPAPGRDVPGRPGWTWRTGSRWWSWPIPATRPWPASSPASRSPPS